MKYNPNYAEALMALGDALRRMGRFDASLMQYAEVVRINPRAAEARFGYAMALVRLRRYREARDWLSEGARVQPDRPELSHALARVLAAAPDEGARDGARAMALVEELMKGTKTTAIGETLAMAMAELGQFRDATDVQRGVMAAARRPASSATSAGWRITCVATSGARRAGCRGPTTIRRIFRPCSRHRRQPVRQRSKVEPHITT